MEVLKGRIYKHFKGDYYIVEDFATDSESGDTYVVYRTLYEDGKLYIRELSMFASKVDKKKYPEVKQEYRFALQEVKSVREKGVK